MISALAVICVRNEAIHIRRCLAHLIDSGLEVRLIDNFSTDGTREIAEKFLGCGLIAIDDLPWNGAFSLTDQLDAKQRIMAESRHDWVVHCDADEWLMAPNEGQTLVEALTEVDESGFNGVNFNEIVFVAMPGEDFAREGYAEKMDTYYFYEPSYPRLNRAWRRDANLTNLSSGGHFLEGINLRIYPIDFVLRHYIMLSEAQAQKKYYNRVFSKEDLLKNWHGNRLTTSNSEFRIRQTKYLKRLKNLLSHQFDLSCPAKAHFWEWL